MPIMDSLRTLARSSALVEGARQIDGPGPVFQAYVTERAEVGDRRDWAATGREGMARLHGLLLDRGVDIVGRRLWFLSTAHDEADIDETIDRFSDALASC